MTLDELCLAMNMDSCPRVRLNKSFLRCLEPQCRDSSKRLLVQMSVIAYHYFLSIYPFEIRSKRLAISKLSQQTRIKVKDWKNVPSVKKKRSAVVSEAVLLQDPYSLAEVALEPTRRQKDWPAKSKSWTSSIICSSKESLLAIECWKLPIGITCIS